MRILILANNDIGLYNFRKELLQRFISDGHDVVISLPYGDRVKDMIEMGCEFKQTDFDRHGTNPLKELKLISQYISLIKSVKPDIVFSYTIKPNIYGSMACKILNVPCVVNITGLGTAVENGGISQKITVMLYKLALGKVQTVFFQNKENMEFFEKKKIRAKSFELLPGSGVNLSRFVPLDYPQSDKTEFVFISRIMKEKGVDQYLDAAEYITQKYPDTVFHVCGFCEQEYEQKLKDLSQKGVIVYHGLVKNVAEILQKTHCTIHPTYYPEGLSNVLLESSASARPIITTNRSGCREVIDDGINGYIVNQKDSKDLIEKIEKFLSLSKEEQKNMGLAGRNKVEKEFDRQIVIEKYVQQLKHVK